MAELQFGIRKRRLFLKSTPMRKQNNGMQNSRGLKWKMIRRGKGSTKKMKRKGHRDLKIEGKGKRERKHLLP